MEYLGISFELGNVPQLEPDFIPFAAWARAYLRGAGVPVSVAVEREGGKVTVRHTRIHGTAELHDADRRYLAVSYTHLISLVMRVSSDDVPRASRSA